ncbi:MAG: arylsulfatase, partial [Bradyrhizobium sp.]
EAEKYQVLPLDSSLVTRLLTPRPSLSAGRTSFTWTRPITGIPNGDAPSLLNASYDFKVDVEIPQGGAEGMLITQGGRFAGYGFYVLKNKPVFTWNLVDLKRVRWEGQELTPGRHVLEFDFRYDGLGPATIAFGNFSGVGQGGTGVLKVDGTAVATEKMEHTIPFILQWDESLDVGSDTGTPVDDDDYATPFVFTGKLNRVTLDIDRPKLSPEDTKRLIETARAAGDGPFADAANAAAAGGAPVSSDVGLSLTQKVELALDKAEICRKVAQKQGLAPLERIQFIRKCLQ